MSKFIDMTGWIMSEHGIIDSRWAVLEKAEDCIEKNGERITMWKCQCSCKNATIRNVRASNLRNGSSLSCGCLNKEISSQICRERNSVLLNKYDLSGEYGIGWTNEGEEFYFDLEDYDLIKNYHWRADKNGYIVANYNKTTVKMHRIIMGVHTKEEVDHISHKVNDNRKSQLRICTLQQNNYNKKMSPKNKSGITGIWWDARREKWESYIRKNNKKIHLGRFENKEDAIRARLEAELKYFGEFAPQRNLFEEYNIT